MKKSLLLLAGFMAAQIPANAQKLTADYITWPGSSKLAEYVNAWNGGNGTIVVDGKVWEDAEFFISRVKPRERFYNNASQVNPGITQYSSSNPNGNDKRCVWWVPMGDHLPDGSLHTNALPNGSYDQDVFSMWSYLDHYGDWTSPFGWSPAALSDAAHKNGVAVSGVASVPFGSIIGEWSSGLTAVGNLNYEDLGKFLLYHGVDGLGYNSEWGGYAPTALIAMHNNLKDYMASRNPLWEVMWYAGTTDNGGISFDSGVGDWGGNTKLFESASMFLNYNWNNSTNTMQRSIDHAKNVGRNPFCIYAGMDQQGGQPRVGESYPILKDYQYSIGLWGAHDYNMFWQGRNANGSMPETKQRTYLNVCEQWFGNGPRNPAIRKDIRTYRSHHPDEDWAGLSSMMSARSAINWAVKNEPFYTFFNLGNGKFFNWKGQRMNDNEWYSLGIQDYLPTWRWWFAPTFMNGNISESDVHLSADFIWDDAYVGGSCLQIAGTTDTEYLHLFKTNLQVMANQKIVVRYKILEGEADVNLVAASGGKPATIANGCRWPVLKAADASDLIDQCYDGEWLVSEFTITPTQYAQISASKGNLGVIALEFKNAKKLKLLLGELGIYAINNTVTPATPEIKMSKVMANTYTGVDGKVIWSMPNTKAVGEPVYNSDVNASMFKVWAQEEGGEPCFLGMTTSWGAIGFRGPNTDMAKKVRFGVSAVSTDTKSESEIGWGQWLDKSVYSEVDDVLLSKNTIKPNEPFAIYYADTNHSSSSWNLYEANSGELVASGNGVRLDVDGLSKIGGYNLKINEGTDKERIYNYFVQISGEEVGAVPEIYTIAHNGSELSDNAPAAIIDITDTPTLSYEGRKSDGSASRGMKINGGFIGVNAGNMGLQSSKSFSVAAWVRLDDFPAEEWNFFNVVNKAASWPRNNWGWCWSYANQAGEFTVKFLSGSAGEIWYSFPDTKLQANIWTHIALVFEYGSPGFRFQLYINGVRQRASWLQKVSGNGGADRFSNMTEDDWSNLFTPTVGSADDICFGGMKYQGAAIDGIIDDFQYWDKAMTQSDVELSMKGILPGNVPDGLKGLWTFENPTNHDFAFVSEGNDKSVLCSTYDFNEVQVTGGTVFVRVNLEPFFQSGCPFLSGTAFPVVTKASWADTDRRTVFTKARQSAGLTEGEAGAADVKFAKEGSHTVTLNLENSYGVASKQFPVFDVKDNAAIGEIGADGDVSTYTVDDVLFLEFAAAGDYMVDVYNTSGMLVASRNAQVTAGQNARITLGRPGVYLVKVVRDGQVLRTVKVLGK